VGDVRRGALAPLRSEPGRLRPSGERQSLLPGRAPDERVFSSNTNSSGSCGSLTAKLDPEILGSPLHGDHHELSVLRLPTVTSDLLISARGWNDSRKTE
jgi:hypothetical protein